MILKNLNKEYNIMTIKKAYVELFDFLEANQNKKVSTLMDELTEMCSAKVAGSTVKKDDDGNVIAVLCYYHKQWEDVSVVEYGKKASSATGLNSMCKLGTSLWTKQNRKAKSANEQLLNDVSAGIVPPTDILDKKADIDAERAVMITDNMPPAYTVE